MNYVLLVWEEISEETKMYVIPCEVADKYLSYLKKAHYSFINIMDWEENEGLKFLKTAVYEYKSSTDYDYNYKNSIEPGFEEYAGIFAKYKHTTDEPIMGKVIEAVYFSGIDCR